MKVPTRLSVVVLALMISFAPGSSRADVAGDAVQFLEAQGYEVVRLERTILGRIRIEAERGELRREMVLDRNSGEVLRDLIREQSDLDDDDQDGLGSFWDRLFGDAGESRDSHDDGDDRNDADDRDDDDRDDDDRDDRDDDRDDGDDRDDSDNSGRGSNNSGSGSDNDRDDSGSGGDRGGDDD